MSLKSTVVTKIKEQLNAVKNVAYTPVLVIVSIWFVNITIIVYVINPNRDANSFVLSVYEMEERHTLKSKISQMNYTELWQNGKLLRK